MSLCSRASSSCYEAQEVVGSNASRVVHSITSLAPCTEYTLSIFPSTGEGELNTQPATLATKPPPARHWPLNMSSFERQAIDKIETTCYQFAPILLPT